MEHDDFSGDISSDIEDDFSDEHEHEPKIKYLKRANGVLFWSGMDKSLHILCSFLRNQWKNF